MTEDASTEDIPVYVLSGGQTSTSDEVLLKGFIDPTPRTEDVRELTLVDGSVAIVSAAQSRRRFSFPLRYDTHGLELFEELTKLENEYYLTACEISLLKTHMETIATHIPDGAAIVELGCGSMTKTAIILDYLRNIAKKKNLRFYGLDIDDRYLRQSLDNLKVKVEKEDGGADHAISYAGIHGTYEELVSFIPNIPGPRFFVWLGSSVGDMTRQEATDLLRLYSEAMSSSDGFFLAADRRNDPSTIIRAYNDSKGIKSELGMNTIVCLNRLLGENACDPTKFKEWSGYNIADGQYESYIKSLVDQTITIPAPFSGDSEKCLDVKLKKDELILYHFSVKYSTEDLEALSATVGMTIKQIWTDPKEMFCLTLLKRVSTVSSS